MRPINLTKLLKGFTSGWVAVSSDYKKVVAHGKTLKEVTEIVGDQQKDDVILVPAAENYRSFHISTLKRFSMYSRSGRLFH